MLGKILLSIRELIQLLADLHLKVWLLYMFDGMSIFEGFFVLPGATR
jgi:hypothetical protein